MTVSELIHRLSQADPDMEVCVQRYSSYIEMADTVISVLETRREQVSHRVFGPMLARHSEQELTKIVLIK